MTFRKAISDLGRLIAAALIYEAGVVVGGMLVTALHLPTPTPPPGADTSNVVVYMLLITPLFVAALAVLARHLQAGFVVRWLSMALLLWVAYTVGTQLEASIVSSYVTGMAFTIISGAVSALAGAAAVAWLFPPADAGQGAWGAVRSFFGHRSALSWVWRLIVSAVVFMPIYFTFGLMVLPFTRAYYEQTMFGLAMPTIQTLLPILTTRSVLFLLVCLPFIVLWRGSRLSLFWRLGLSLFMLVGFNIMLIATWMPLAVRGPHTLEILADEFVYAGALVLLLAPPTSAEAPSRETPSPEVPEPAR